MSDPSVDPSLSELLTADILREIFKARNPWPADKVLDFAAVRDFASCFDTTRFRAVCYPALSALSAVGIERVPDLLSFLSPPSEPAFPEQAIGLLLLLDQGPRQLFDGIDVRWTFGYFDVLASQVVRKLMELPDNLAVHNRARWVNAELGYTFSHWAYIRFWFVAPLVHSERMDDQDTAARLCEETRKAVEEREGVQDAYRDCRDEIANDPTAFQRRAMMGPPRGETIAMHEFMFWFLMIFDTHMPILKTFGRFPSRNGALGRELTEEEKAFLERTGGFGGVKADVADTISEGSMDAFGRN